MPRDRKRRRRRAGDRAIEPAFEHHPLAPGLETLRRAAARAPEPEPTSEPLPPPPLQLTEHEYMQRVFAALDHEEAAEAQGGTLSDAIIVRARPTRPSPQDERAETPPEQPVDPERLEFERGLARIRGRPRAGPGWRDHHPPAARTAEELEGWSLTPDQEALLAAVARHEGRGRGLPRLSVRKLRRERALERLVDFVHTHRALGHRYVRVITGKGLSSFAAPVLKPEIITWCEHRGRGAVVLWAPERDADGSFGSLVLRLRSPRRACG